MNTVLKQKSNLPNGWQRLAIEDVAEVNPRIDKSEIPDDLAVSFVPMPAVGAESGAIDVSQERPFSEVRKGFTQFIEGDVLFAKITPCMENGKMAVVSKVKNGYGFGSTEFHVLRSKEGMVAKYLYYFVSSRTFRGVAQHYMSGAVGQKRVSTSYLKQQLIPLAPPEQQERIVAKIEELFSHIDAGIEALKKAKQLLKQYRQSVLKAAVTGELTKEWRANNEKHKEDSKNLINDVIKQKEQQNQLALGHWKSEMECWNKSKKGKKPSKPKKIKLLPSLTEEEISILPAIPESWMWKKLFNYSEDVVVGYVGPVKKHITDKSSVRFLSTTHIGENRFINKEIRYVTEEFDSENRKSHVRTGDILIARHGDSGKACIVPDYIESAQVSNGVIVRVVPKITNSKYLCYALNATRNELQRKKVGGLQQVVNTQSMSEFPVPIPGLAEQDVIVKELERKTSEIDALEKVIELQIKKAEKNKQSILASAFSGAVA